MKIGYLRVSTKTQNPARQINGLRDLCDKLFVETLSAIADDRPVFDMMLGELREGDTLFVWDLDRAFRSTEDALYHERSLRERGIGFHAMNFDIETQSADGRYAYIVQAAAAERERMKISERTIEGLKAARARGQRLGPPIKMTKDKAAAAKASIDAKLATVSEIASTHGVHRSTVYRSLKRLDDAIPS